MTSPGPRPAYRPRDAAGRRIPREGTISRKIYDLVIVEGLPNIEAADRLDLSHGLVGVLKHRFSHPEATNARHRKRRPPAP